MSETDSCRDDEVDIEVEGQRHITEKSPLLWKTRQAKIIKTSYKRPDSPQPDPRDIREHFKCTKNMLILTMLCVALLFLKLCVDYRAIEDEFGPEGIPFLDPVVQDVVLPDESRTLSVAYHAALNTFELLQDPQDTSATARATYHTNVNNNGWNFFEAKALPASTTHASYLDSMRAMGYLEGYTSWQQIADFYPNYYQSIFDTKNPVLCNPDLRVLRFLQDNYDHMQWQSQLQYQSSLYWLTVRGLLAQLDGMLAGFVAGREKKVADDAAANAAVDAAQAVADAIGASIGTNAQNGRRVLKKTKGLGDVTGMGAKDLSDQDLLRIDMTTLDRPTVMHFLMLNGNGDMFTLIEKLADADNKMNLTFTGVDCALTRRRATASTESEEEEMEEEQEEEQEEEEEEGFVNEYGSSVLARKRAKLTGKGQNGYRTDHCSALVKVLPKTSDVVFGHNTWDDYRNMGPRIFKHYIYPKWPLTVLSYHSKCRPQGRKCEKECALREATPPSHTYFTSSPGWLTSVDDFYATFAAPLPPPVDEVTVDEEVLLNEALECGCVCGGGGWEVAAAALPTEGGSFPAGQDAEAADVEMLLTAEEVEAAVQEHILDAQGSAEEGISTWHHSTHPRHAPSPVIPPRGRLAIIETSLEIYNPDLYDMIVPNSLLSWVRARSANILAQSGADWATQFSFEHSGTYPNQWIILDFDKYTKSDFFFTKSRLHAGFLTVLEEMPGMIRSADQTNHLTKHTYWASYNIPFYQDLSEYSRNTQLCKTQRDVYVFKNATIPGVDATTNSNADNDRLGNANCYSSCSRAKLFSRLQRDVVDIESAMLVLSHNDFKHDKEANGNPCEEIACREDLEELDENLNVFGAVDAKVSSVVEADIVYRGRGSPEHQLDHPVKTVAPAAKSGSTDPVPLHFPLPKVDPSFEDLSYSGDFSGEAGTWSEAAAPEADGSEVEGISMHSSRWRDKRRPVLYKQPRMFARQGPTHDHKNPPFCWNVFEERHDAWVARLKAARRNATRDTGRRLRREVGGGAKSRWRKRKPAFKYSHAGQPNCFNYEWQMMPPQ